MASRKKPIIERVNNLLKSSGDATKSQSNHLAVSLTPGPRSTQHQRRLKKMEISMPMLLCSSLVLVLISSVYSVPIDVARETENDHHLEEKRPKYMDTRDLDAFEKLVYLALKGLVEEGKVNPEVMTSEANEGFLDNQGENGESKEKAGPADKRGHLRICVRRSGSRYVPYPCFRS